MFKFTESVQKHQCFCTNQYTRLRVQMHTRTHSPHGVLRSRKKTFPRRSSLLTRVLLFHVHSPTHPSLTMQDVNFGKEKNAQEYTCWKIKILSTPVITWLCGLEFSIPRVLSLINNSGPWSVRTGISEMRNDFSLIFVMIFVTNLDEKHVNYT